jgi:hypothetical protein
MLQRGVANLERLRSLALRALIRGDVSCSESSDARAIAVGVLFLLEGARKFSSTSRPSCAGQIGKCQGHPTGATRRDGARFGGIGARLLVLEDAHLERHMVAHAVHHERPVAGRRQATTHHKSVSTRRGGVGYSSNNSPN